MSRISRVISSCRTLALLAALIVVFPKTVVWGMGLSPIGGGTTSAVSCIPEENPVIVPGPLGSPLRIDPVGSDSFVIADYRKGAIFQVSSATVAAPVQLFTVEGKPLSVVKLPARSGTTYLIGNDATKTIDVYVERRGRIAKRTSLFRRVPVQALDMAVNENTGRVYVVDGLAAEIKIINLNGRLVGSFGGFGQLANPKGIALDLARGEVLVTDYGISGPGISASIQIFDLDGRHLDTMSGNFSRPQGVTVAEGRIYVADAVLGQILAFDRTTGAVAGSYGCFGSSAGHLWLPMDVTLDTNARNLLVADNSNGRISILPLNP